MSEYSLQLVSPHVVGSCRAVDSLCITFHAAVGQNQDMEVFNSKLRLRQDPTAYYLLFLAFNNAAPYLPSIPPSQPLSVIYSVLRG